MHVIWQCEFLKLFTTRSFSSDWLVASGNMIKTKTQVAQTARLTDWTHTHTHTHTFIHIPTLIRIRNYVKSITNTLFS